jgi:hypothetical protein
MTGRPYDSIMNNVPYRVFVVLDRECGARLSQLVMSGPVWALDSPTNRAAAEIFWSQFPSRDHLDGVTIFKASAENSLEEVLIDELQTIDMHHGVHSADPPYTVLQIIGTVLTARIEAALSEYGFNSFRPTPEGFQAIRPSTSSS